MKRTLIVLLSGFTLFVSLSSAKAVVVEVANAPENDLALTLGAIGGARQTVEMNIYELSSPEIAAALVDRVQAGVSVRVLEESSPVGGYSQASAEARDLIVGAMNAAQSSADHHFYLMQKPAIGKRRFRYDHAKYTVIDGNKLLVGSENYSPGGNSNGEHLGNRGWEVFIHDANLAAKFHRTFVADTASANSDIVDLMKATPLAFRGFTSLVQGEFFRSIRVAPATFHQNVATFHADRVTAFFSPDGSLQGLTDLISGAKQTLDLELMTFTPDWGSPRLASPLLAAVSAAVARGVAVRVLLNDENVFARINGGVAEDVETHLKRDKNLETVNSLRSLSGNVGAAIADLKAMGVTFIHNKGVLVDGDRVLISSINWDENSVEKNREAAVVLNGKEIFDYYRTLYEQDWNVSARH